MSENEKEEPTVTMTVGGKSVTVTQEQFARVAETGRLERESYDDEPLSLSTMLGGAAEQEFQRLLEEVLVNIADPNTEAGAARKITIEFSIHPDGRAGAKVKLKTSCKLAPHTPLPGKIYVGKHRGKMRAFEEDPRQQKMFNQ